MALGAPAVIPKPHTSMRHPRKARSLSRQDSVFGLLMVAPVLVYTGIFFGIPTLLMVWMSLHDWPLLGDPTFVGMGNFSTAFADPVFRHAVVFSLGYALVQTPLVVALALLMASLVRRQSKGSALFRIIYLMPYVMGFGSSAFLWYWMVDDRTGAVKAVLLAVGINVNQSAWLSEFIPGVIVVITLTIWKTVGFFMLLMMSGMQSISDEVYEAATLDGANKVKQFFFITLPLLRPTLVMVFIFAITWGVLVFDQFYILTSGRPDNRTVSVVHWIFTNSFVRFDLGYGAALSVLVVLGLAAITYVQLKMLRNPED
ncbi:carbohydrate ABC transporter permease [Nesterenkonia alba]|uniref:carbohydrate ABC transporter permease n=1 Tax=Nesterenkonia alba TaxID=515814 RepID=UPI0003B30128|nr:sugar ABC transporter permease [Nesterenkonia alba]